MDLEYEKAVIVERSYGCEIKDYEQYKLTSKKNQAIRILLHIMFFMLGIMYGMIILVSLIN